MNMFYYCEVTLHIVYKVHKHHQNIIMEKKKYIAKIKLHFYQFLVTVYNVYEIVSVTLYKKEKK